MKVQIYHEGKLVGHSNLDATDPPMGVATGLFEPSASYEPKVHAGEIEGTHNPSGANLTYVVESAEHGAVECQAVFIQDYSDSLNERQVSIIGIPSPDYENCFEEYPSFRNYWGKS
ncbi:hypothetical protein M8312_11870 [Sphingomonas sp. KRR8]|uniref:hypothetical protein n=1 Tax=Sphingomonas sp. KRR8 TaxID=2942996 RepID=UPI0020209652|nr:hypothetical protein [Sphingomonas sp. KRR8]URD60473.1 hypothetical protein M8312_11870 [Sphingomonas sp. KRR8]